MSNKIIKVLYVNGGIMDRGGVSSVMMNYYLNMNPNEIQIDFLVHGLETGERDNEILSRKSKIFRVVPKSKNLLKNYKQIKKILMEERYDIIHAHADVGNAYILKIAKKCGIKVRISHCHNTNYTISNKIRIIINDLQKKAIKKYATDLWACSRKASYWLYDTTEGVYILNNAINGDKYTFSSQARESLRSKYKCEDRIVIGMVGRLDTQKNHKYAIKIIKNLNMQYEKIILICVGDGELKNELTEYVKKEKLEDQIIFTGSLNNVNQMYSAFDVLIMPSLFEGLPVTVIEAQYNGLPCVLSNKITSEVKISNNIEYLPIDNNSISQWVSCILNAKRFNVDIDCMNKQGFDIKTEAKKLVRKYYSMLRN